MSDHLLKPIPASWAIAQIADVASVNPKIDRSLFDEGLEVQFVPMTAIGAGTGKVALNEVRSFADVQKGFTPFLEGDVLFAKITPCMENGKMAVVPKLRNDIGFGSTEFHVLRPYDGISALYLYYYVSSERFRRDAEHNMTGAVGQRRVPTTYLSQHPLPLPPTKEQHRIAAKIETLFSELDKGVESLANAREQLRTYRQAFLKRAFEGRMTSTWRKDKALHEWTLISVGGAAKHIVDCLHSTPTFAASGKYCIDSTWIEDNKVMFEQARFVDEMTYQDRIKRMKPKRGDVLFVREGSKKIGTALVVNFDDECCLGQRMMMLRLGEQMLPKYFVYYIQSDNFKKQYKPLIGGSASPHLNISDIRRMTVPLCSLEEQRELIRIIDSQFSVLDAIDSAIEAEVQKSQVLRDAVLKRAFSGQLVLQDQNEEFASVLLRRIRAEKEDSGSDRKKNNKNGKKEAA
jgi:type I restriction enzyme S subunit